MKSRILAYQLSDSKRGLWTIAILHVLLFLMMLIPEDTSLMSWGRPQLCLLIAAGSIALFRYYAWLDYLVNLGWAAVYGALLIYEWQAFGLPESLVQSPVGPTISKGFMLDVMLHFLPWIYGGIRVMGGIYLLMIIRVALRGKQATATD